LQFFFEKYIAVELCRAHASWEQVKWVEREKYASTHRFAYTSELAINSTNSDTQVNVLYYEELDPKGKKQTFTRVTAICLTKANVWKAVHMSRAHWKIENETFNTLKNQVYNGDV
jgi:hypothetical protein